MIVYLDNSATTKPYDEVTSAVIRYLQEDYGNPSSLHGMGIKAELAIKKARNEVAALIDKGSGDILFGSGGTEANNMVAFGLSRKTRPEKRRIISSDVEHPSIKVPFEELEKSGWEIIKLKTDGQGLLITEDFKNLLNEKTSLVSIMHVNNETGAIFPINQLSEEIRTFNKKTGSNILLHTDCTQSLAKLGPPANADLISMSAHKIHGPKGAGALYVKKGISWEALLFGGGQEKNLRSGTENVPAIAGFGMACQLALGKYKSDFWHVVKLKEYLFDGLNSELSDLKLNGLLDHSKFSPYILNISFLGVKAEVLLHYLEEKGIYVSTGSACSSHSKGLSYVLKSMGLSEEEMGGAIRFSFTAENTFEEMDYVIVNIKSIVRRMRHLLINKGKK